MDAKRIAEIRESAAAVVALCGSRQSAFMSASEAIALCDLAAEALEYRAGTNMLADAFRAASANPKHERRG